MKDLIQRLVDGTGIDAETAEKAVGIILNFINREGPPEEVRTLMASLPGVDAYLAAPPGAAVQSTGFGGFGGGAMAAFNELTGAGLGMGEIQSVTRIFMDYAKEHAGEDVVGQVVGGIPGLSQFV